jgi:hypothetical protein
MTNGSTSEDSDQNRATRDYQITHARAAITEVARSDQALDVFQTLTRGRSL